MVIPDVFDDEGKLTIAALFLLLIDFTWLSVGHFFGSQALRGLTFGIYEHSEVDRDLPVAIVEALGGLGRSDIFIRSIQSRSAGRSGFWPRMGEKWQFDAIVSTDGIVIVHC